MEDKRLLGNIELSINQGIATIKFYHPSHNSMPARLLADLSETIKRMGEHEDVRVLVLQSKGEKTFCAGASFDELISIKDKENGHKFFMGFANVINACRKCPKIIIGRVQGKAIGGGVGIASATDYCFALKTAAVKLSELAVGIGPFVVGPAFVVGLASADRLSALAGLFAAAVVAGSFAGPVFVPFPVP